MLKIHKYPLGAEGGIIYVPMGTKILHAGLQREALKVWALVETPSTAVEARTFMVFATGQEIPKDVAPKLVYVSTIMPENGTFVFHVFEKMS